MPVCISGADIRDENNRPDGGYVIFLNDYLISGSFPNSAKPILETTVVIEALPHEHLPMMREYRKKKIKADLESRP